MMLCCCVGRCFSLRRTNRGGGEGRERGGRKETGLLLDLLCELVAVVEVFLVLDAVVDQLDELRGQWRRMEERSGLTGSGRLWQRAHGQAVSNACWGR